MIRLTMPQLGEDVTEATIVRWLKRVGERVEADEPLVEIETEKVNVEVPAEQAGILRAIFVSEGETVAAGAALAEIEPAGGERA